MRFGKHLIGLSAMGGLTASLLGAPCNSAPTVVGESVSVLLHERQIVDVLASAQDLDGQMLAVSIVSRTCPTQISAVVDPTQTITLTAGGLAPPCVLRYRVDDGDGGSAAANLTVTVDPGEIFSDGFELGSTAAWSETEP
jgi:hypothetical protein